MLALRRTSVLVLRSVKAFFDDGCSQRAAAISYYVLFSLFPLVIFTVGILGLVLKDQKLQADVVGSVMKNIPLSQDKGRDEVTNALQNVASTRSSAIGILGLLTLAWSGSSMFGVVRSSLNHVFHQTAPRPIVLQKLIDLGIVLAFAPFFIGSVVATSALRLARSASQDLHYLGNLPEKLGAAWWIASTALPIAISFAAFFLTYWLIPARRTRAKYVVPGALLAATLFEIVKVGFTVYLEHFSSYDVVFGSLGAVVAFLFWVYLSSNILLLGAEFVSEMPDVMAGRFDLRTPGPPRTNKEKVVRLLRSLVLRPRDDGPEDAGSSGDDALPAARAARAGRGLLDERGLRNEAGHPGCDADEDGQGRHAGQHPDEVTQADVRERRVPEVGLRVDRVGVSPCRYASPSAGPPPRDHARPGRYVFPSGSATPTSGAWSSPDSPRCRTARLHA